MRVISDKNSRPLFSICIPNYQGKDYIPYCFESIFETFEELNISYEIIIVDNYSTDGSFELLMEYSRKYPNIKVIRAKSSRGRARQLALQLAQGSYIIPMDIDVKLIPSRMKKLILSYLQSSYRDTKGIATVRGGGAIGIFPRKLLIACGGWSDLNYDENVDLLTRLYLRNALITIPIQVCEDLYPIVIRKTREMRYAKGLKYFLRYFRNRLDLTCGNGDTLRKVIIVFRYLYQRSIFTTLLTCLRHVVMKALNVILKRKCISAHPYLPNRLYVIYKRITTVVNPREFGFDYSEVTFYSEKDPDVQLISKYYPNVIRILKSLSCARS